MKMCEGDSRKRINVVFALVKGVVHQLSSRVVKIRLNEGNANNNSVSALWEIPNFVK